jgi:electron transfer flavoprotein beta subunit
VQLRILILLPVLYVNSLVLIKQVPDTTAVSEKAMKPDGTLNRAALPAVFNPEDLNALELALDIRERCGGAVCVMSMGPPAAAEILREALYRGADRAVLLTDRLFAGSDTLATSSVLACAVKAVGTFDLIICGRQAIDGNTAQVGPQVAEKLNLNQITYVSSIQAIDRDGIRAWREVEGGRECVQSQLPVLLTVVDTANTPRPPSAKKVMRYKHARAPVELAPGEDPEVLARKGLLIEQLGAADIGAKPAVCGLQGSPTRVQKITGVVFRGRQLKQIAPTDDALRELFVELMAEYTFD